MQRFKNTILFIPIFFKLLFKVFYVSEFKHLPWLKTQIRQIEKNVGESLAASYHKRFRLYTIIATIFISWLETLHGKKLSLTAKHTALLFCGLTPLFDDLFDDFNYSATEIKSLSQKKIQRNTLIEKICIALFEKIEYTNGHLEWTALWEKVLDYQIYSQEQQHDTIDDIRLIDITKGKGGYSLLLYFEAILDKNYPKAEADAVFQLGYLIQLTNDIFDVYKDRNAGITTLATKASDMHQLKVFYNNEVKKNVAQFEALPYKKRNIDSFIIQYMLIVSRGWVALEQLCALQTAEIDNRFQLHKYSRKQLVCDMELWKNIRKSLLYTLDYQKKMVE